MLPNTDLRDKLASLEHEQWKVWTKYFLNNLNPENINRWKKQIKLKYEQLSEKEKVSDRKWADKVLKYLHTLKV